jgi:hypothetical protein
MILEKLDWPAVPSFAWTVCSWCHKTMRQERRKTTSLLEADLLFLLEWEFDV